MYTVDTNILIYHANGDKKVVDFLTAQFAREAPLFLPAVVLVEFFSFPALTPEAERVFKSLLNYFVIVSLDYSTTLEAATVRKTYRLKLGDSIIAACALMKKIPLITRNVRDFKKVNGLEVIDI
ncbi:MAG: type II toxin-antitoxin system VapC family toxin [Patescibacteria group bacterium]